MNFDAMKTLLDRGFRIYEINVNRFHLEIKVVLTTSFESVTFDRSYPDSQSYVGDLVNLTNLIVDNVNTNNRFVTNNL